MSNTRRLISFFEAFANPTVPSPTVPSPTVPSPTVPSPTVPSPTVPSPTATIIKSKTSIEVSYPVFFKHGEKYCVLFPITKGDACSNFQILTTSSNVFDSIVFIESQDARMNLTFQRVSSFLKSILISEFNDKHLLNNRNIYHSFSLILESNVPFSSFIYLKYKATTMNEYEASKFINCCESVKWFV
jgi:hypothetical protein